MIILRSTHAMNKEPVISAARAMGGSYTVDQAMNIKRLRLLKDLAGRHSAMNVGLGDQY